MSSEVPLDLLRPVDLPRVLDSPAFLVALAPADLPPLAAGLVVRFVARVVVLPLAAVFVVFAGDLAVLREVERPPVADLDLFRLEERPPFPIVCLFAKWFFSNCKSDLL